MPLLVSFAARSLSSYLSVRARPLHHRCASCVGSPATPSSVQNLRNIAGITALGQAARAVVSSRPAGADRGDLLGIQTPKEGAEGVAEPLRDRNTIANNG